MSKQYDYVEYIRIEVERVVMAEQRIITKETIRTANTFKGEIMPDAELLRKVNVMRAAIHADAQKL